MTLYIYNSGQLAELQQTQEAFHILSQRQYPRTCVSTSGGPTVVVTQHAGINESEEFVFITQEVVDWWAEEQARPPEEQLLSGEQKGLFTAVMAQLEEYAPPEDPPS